MRAVSPVARPASPTGYDAVVLRYFNCRGRGQALRYFLVDSGIAFADERFEADLSWPTFKGAAQGGPFGSLPVLHWGEHTIGQALAIAGYLTRRLGLDQGRDCDELALLESVTSAAYLDLTCVVRELLRPRVMPNDEQWPAFFASFLDSIPARLPSFERLLGARGTPFFGGVEPAAADYFVFEAVDAWLELLGVRLVAALATCPRLRDHHSAVFARPNLKAYLASGARPNPLTASPLEREIRERLSKVLASGEGDRRS
jgi:Glutathione S-transferase, C-terminal domain